MFQGCVEIFRCRRNHNINICRHKSSKSDGKKFLLIFVYLLRFQKTKTLLYLFLQDATNHDAKYFLLYYYYGGMIYTAIKNYERALYFFEVCISTPAMAMSYIMLEAYKKFILVSLILHGKVTQRNLTFDHCQEKTSAFCVYFPDYTHTKILLSSYIAFYETNCSSISYINSCIRHYLQ